MAARGVAASAAKRAAEQPLEKGRGRSPRTNPGEPQAAAFAADLKRVKDNSAARANAAAVLAQAGRDEVEHLNTALNHANADVARLYLELSKAHAGYQTLASEHDNIRAQHVATSQGLQEHIIKITNELTVMASNNTLEEQMNARRIDELEFQLKNAAALAAQIQKRHVEISGEYDASIRALTASRLTDCSQHPIDVTEFSEHP